VQQQQRCSGIKGYAGGKLEQGMPWVKLFNIIQVQNKLRYEMENDKILKFQ